MRDFVCEAASRGPRGTRPSAAAPPAAHAHPCAGPGFPRRPRPEARSTRPGGGVVSAADAGGGALPAALPGRALSGGRCAPGPTPSRGLRRRAGAALPAQPSRCQVALSPVASALASPQGCAHAEEERPLAEAASLRREGEARDQRRRVSLPSFFFFLPICPPRFPPSSHVGPLCRVLCTRPSPTCRCCLALSVPLSLFPSLQAPGDPLISRDLHSPPLPPSPWGLL